MRTIIHVNQQVLRSNRKTGANAAPITCRTYKGTQRARQLDLVAADGTVVASFKYSPDKPLACGATIWCEVPSGISVRRRRLKRA